MTGTDKILVINSDCPNCACEKEIAELCGAQVFVIEPTKPSVNLSFVKKEKNWKPKKYYQR